MYQPREFPNATYVQYILKQLAAGSQSPGFDSLGTGFPFFFFFFRLPLARRGMPAAPALGIVMIVGGGS